MDGGAHTAFAQGPLGGGGDHPLKEAAPVDTEEADVMFVRRGCCCFWVPRFGPGRSSPAAWERIGGGSVAEGDEPWWRRALMKVREWSEVVAGPRWKTFIRRFNRNLRWGSGGGGRAGKFQYDPLSYALNFDHGHEEDGDAGGDYGNRNFSARYVLPPPVLRASMDPGGRDAPTLFAAE